MDQLEFQHTLAKDLAFQLEEEMLESCAHEHNMGKHVDECQMSDVWKGSPPSSLGQVDNRMKRVIELHHQGARSTSFPLHVIIVA
jgi:hypothetical protein